MKPSPLPDPPPVKRKRIAVNHRSSIQEQVYEAPAMDGNSYYLSLEVERLEKKVAHLINQSEAYHLLVQKHYSDKVKLQNRVAGVLKHIHDVMNQVSIPGGKIKIPQILDPVLLHQENKLLRWKMNVIEKFFENSFPELEIDESLTCSGTPVK